MRRRPLDQQVTHCFVVRADSLVGLRQLIESAIPKVSFRMLTKQYWLCLGLVEGLPLQVPSVLLDPTIPYNPARSILEGLPLRARGVLLD